MPLGKSPCGIRRPTLKNLLGVGPLSGPPTPMRIVSLLPAATEICFALGLGDDLVGVSPECDYPHAVREKPTVSHALLQYDGKTSGDTSRMARERIRSGRAFDRVGAS